MHRLRALNLFMSIALLCAPGAVRVAAQKEITASNAWIKLPAAGETAAAAYVTINNPGMYDTYVLSASSEDATAVELRVPPAGGGTPAVVKEVPVAAYDSLEMKPGGAHLWLTGLKHPLKAGDKVALTIVMDGGLSLPVQAEVR